MARRYIQVYYDLIDSLTPLSDAERGRLLTAMLEYAGRGAAPDLRGNERFIWPQIKGQIDRDNEKYESKVEQCRDAGSQGGKANASGRYRTQTDATKNKRTQTDASQNKDKDKDKDKDKNKDDDKDRAHATCGGGLLTDAEIQSLADGIHDVLDAAKRAGFPDTQADWDMCNGIVADYGADAVLKAIKTCTGYAMDKRTWVYLRGILKSDPTGGTRKKQAEKGKGYSNPFADMAFAEMEKEHEQS